MNWVNTSQVVKDIVVIILWRITADNAVLGTGISSRTAVAQFFLVSIGSICVGLALAWVACLIFKHIDLTHHRAVEIAVFVLMAYFPFVIAETLELSGLVAVMFAGFAMKHYWYVGL